MPAVVRALGGLRRFSGRDSRPQFWWYVLVVFVASVVVDLVVSSALPSGADERGWQVAWDLFGAVVAVVLLAAAVVRRLHDSGRSGLWALLPVPTSLIGLGLLIGGFEVTGELGFSSVVALINAVAAIALVVLLAQPGTDGANRFGPDPGS